MKMLLFYKLLLLQHKFSIVFANFGIRLNGKDIGKRNSSTDIFLTIFFENRLVWIYIEKLTIESKKKECTFST